MARPIVTELSDEQIVERYRDNTFRKVYARTNAIPASYDGKYALLTAIAVNSQITEAQMDALEGLIEGIAGVHKAFVLVGPSRIPTDRVGDGEELFIEVDCNFEMEETPSP